jgi:hypothetical protein
MVSHNKAFICAVRACRFFSSISFGFYVVADAAASLCLFALRQVAYTHHKLDYDRSSWAERWPSDEDDSDDTDVTPSPTPSPALRNRPRSPMIRSTNRSSLTFVRASVASKKQAEESSSDDDDDDDSDSESDDE